MKHYTAWEKFRMMLGEFLRWGLGFFLMGWAIALMLAYFTR